MIHLRAYIELLQLDGEARLKCEPGLAALRDFIAKQTDTARDEVQHTCEELARAVARMRKIDASTPTTFAQAETRSAIIVALYEALSALKKVAKEQPGLQGRDHLPLGMQVNEALNKAGPEYARIKRETAT